MRNILLRTSALITGIFFLSTGLIAQDLKKAQEFYKIKDYEKAKLSIDAAVKGTEGNKPETWIWKHKIYWQLGTDPNWKAKYADAMLQGFEALRKARLMPKGDETMLKELGIEYNKPFNDYYVTFINKGSAEMNAEKFLDAYNNFISAIAVSTFFYEQKMIATDLDTMLTFYAGYTAMKAGNDGDAARYFKKLTDRNASGTDIQIAYGFLTNHFLKTLNNIASAKAVYEKGIKLYPNDEYLRSMNIQIAQQSGNPEEIFKVYENVIASGKAEFADYLGYGAELYDYMYVDSGRVITNAAAKEARMVEVLNKALQLRSGSAETNYILGMYYTSKALMLDKQLKSIKGTSPEAVKQKKDIQALINDYAAKSVKYLEMTATLYRAKTTLKPNEKDHYKTALQQLVNLYKYLAKPDKVKETEDLLKKISN